MEKFNTYVLPWIAAVSFIACTIASTLYLLDLLLH